MVRFPGAPAARTQSGREPWPVAAPRGTGSVASWLCPGLELRWMQTRALLLLLSRLLSSSQSVLRAPHLHGVHRVHDGVLQNPGHRSRCHVGGHRGAGR